MKKSSNLYTVGQISKLCNIPIQTLHFYDKEDLLKPEIRDAQSNYRFYSEKQLIQILIIKELKRLGFPLHNIKDFIKQKDLNKLINEMEAKQTEIEDNIRNLQIQLEMAINHANLVKSGLKILESFNSNGKAKKAYHIELKEIPEFPVVFTRYASRCYAEELFVERYVELLTIRDQYQLFSYDPFMAVFHDHYSHQFFRDEGELEVCLPLVKEKENCPAVKKFGGFLAATTIHVGRYADALPGYLALITWIENNDYELAGPAVEEYIIGPNNTDYEENYVTRIILPIKKI
ncbi:MAG: MerR family transcriptional regulator [Dehalobacterium sp.]